MSTQQREYQAPAVSNVTNGQMPFETLKEKGVEALIPVYDFMAIGDEVSLKFMTDPPGDPDFTGGSRVTSVAPFLLKAHRSQIVEDARTLRVWYTVLDKGSSESVHIELTR